QPRIVDLVPEPLKATPRGRPGPLDAAESLDFVTHVEVRPELDHPALGAQTSRRQQVTAGGADLFPQVGAGQPARHARVDHTGVDTDAGREPDLFGGRRTVAHVVGFVLAGVFLRPALHVV